MTQSCRTPVQRAKDALHHPRHIPHTRPAHHFTKAPSRVTYESYARKMVSHSGSSTPTSSSPSIPQPERLSAHDLIHDILDTDSWDSWDTKPDYGEVSDDYAASLARAREKSGVDEAVITGAGTIDGHRVTVVASEFSFLGGSIGAATSRRIIDAIHRATAESLPLLISPASGGTRMQEGTPAFALMISITAAIHRHKDQHLPYLVYLRHPTTGGAMASWGSAGHLTFAQPGATLGFLGPASLNSRRVSLSRLAFRRASISPATGSSMVSSIPLAFVGNLQNFSTFLSALIMRRNRPSRRHRRMR